MLGNYKISSLLKIQTTDIAQFINLGLNIYNKLCTLSPNPPEKSLLKCGCNHLGNFLIAWTPKIHPRPAEYK